MADLNEQLRAEFEAWAKESGYPLDKCEEGSRIGPVGSYKHTTTIHAWEVWQAARRQHGSAAQAVACTHPFRTGTAEYVARGEFTCSTCGFVAAPPDAEGVKGKTAAHWYVAYCEKSEQLKAADGAINRYAQRVTELEADLAWHKEALARHAEKLGAVWQGIREAVEEATGEPCGPEPFDDLHAALSRRPAAAAEQTNPTAQEIRVVAAEQPAAEPDLLPLPDDVIFGTSRFGTIFRGYTADQVHAYARAHLRAAGQGKDSERLDELMKVARESLQMHDLVTGGSDYGYISPKLREVVESIDAAMKAGAQGGGK